MKKSIVASILGLAAAVPFAASGAGYIYIGNEAGDYPTYNPVMWQAPMSQEVLSSQGVQLTLWFGEGALSENQLNNSLPLQWNTADESSGFPGFYGPTLVYLPDWVAGDTYTFQVRASGNSVYGVVNEALSRSVLWQENFYIAPGGQTPPAFPPPTVPFGVSQKSIGLTVYVPEPSALSLAGLGLGGWLFLRRPTRG
jgi:hypothetical protein